MKTRNHEFEDGEKVRIKETNEIVTVDYWWFIKNKPLSQAQYNIIEKPGTWFMECELEKILL
jgi:hypothetical protein